MKDESEFWKMFRYTAVDMLFGAYLYTRGGFSLVILVGFNIISFRYLLRIFKPHL